MTGGEELEDRNREHGVGLGYHIASVLVLFFGYWILLIKKFLWGLSLLFEFVSRACFF